jgi:hypothetical protein
MLFYLSAQAALTTFSTSIVLNVNVVRIRLNVSTTTVTIGDLGGT